MYDLQVASLRTTTIKHWPNLNEARLRALLKDHRSVGTGDAAWFLNGPEKHIQERSPWRAGAAHTAIRQITVCPGKPSPF
jgi:hypothetical protein